MAHFPDMTFQDNASFSSTLNNIYYLLYRTCINPKCDFSIFQCDLWRHLSPFTDQRLNAAKLFISNLIKAHIWSHLVIIVCASTLNYTCTRKFRINLKIIVMHEFVLFETPKYTLITVIYFS